MDRKVRIVRGAYWLGKESHGEGLGEEEIQADVNLVGKDDYNDNDDTTKAVLQRVDFDDFSKVVEAGGRPLGYR